MAFTDHFKAKIGADTASLEQSVKKANGKVQNFATNVSSMFQKFLAVGAVTSFITKTKEMTVGLADVSDKLGVSVEFLQKFRFASEQSGVKIGEAEMGLQRFLRRAGTAYTDGGELLDVLNDLGVQITDTSGKMKSGEQLFLDFADAIGKVEDPNVKLTKAFKLLDSEGIKLLQLIGDGSGKFKDLANQAENLGLILDEKMIKEIREADNELKQAITQLEKLATMVLPPVIKAINLAIAGWQGLYGICKLLNVELQLFARTVFKEITDAFTSFDAHINLIIAKANAFKVKINPFTSDDDLAKANARVERYARYAEQVDNRTKNTFQQNRNEILKLDTQLAKERIQALEDIEKASKKSKAILDGNMKVNLSDSTSQDLSEIQNTRTAIKDQHDLHTQSIDDKLQSLSDAEDRINKNTTDQQKKLEDSKIKILNSQNEIITIAKKEFQKIANEINTNSVNLISSIKGLSVEVSKISPAISGITIPSIPTSPAPPPTVIQVDIDTTELSKESTQIEVRDTLKGYFVNQ